MARVIPEVSKTAKRGDVCADRGVVVSGPVQPSPGILSTTIFGLAWRSLS